MCVSSSSYTIQSNRFANEPTEHRMNEWTKIELKLDLIENSLWFAEEACSTPNRQAGTCIPLRECSSLYQLLSARPLTEQNRLFLANSQCAFRNRSPYVCRCSVHQIGRAIFIWLCFVVHRYAVRKVYRPQVVLCRAQNHSRVHLVCPYMIYHHEVPAVAKCHIA